MFAIIRDNKPDYRTVVDQYYEAPQPDLPIELQFLSPDKQRKVFESYCILYDLSSEELPQREDLIVDYLVYTIAPRLLANRYNTERRFPRYSYELYEMIERFTWSLLRHLLKWREFQLPQETQELLVDKVSIAIQPFLHTGDHGISPEVQSQMARERLFAAGILPLRSHEDSPDEEMARLCIQQAV